MMFTTEQRLHVRDHLIEKAQRDGRVTGAALVGSSATGEDRWSDLDVSLAVATGCTVESVLESWTAEVAAGFDAAILFDVTVGVSIYRVFLLPGALQVDLSFTPEFHFGPRGPRFHLLFGQIGESAGPASVGTPDAPSPIGLAVHHLVRGFICVERGRVWQAEYWLHEARDLVLTLACEHRGLDTNYGRGWDALPDEVRIRSAGMIAAHLEPAELRRALAETATMLLSETAGSDELIDRVRPMLAELSAPYLGSRPH